MGTSASSGRFPGFSRSFNLLRGFSAFLLIGTAVALFVTTVATGLADAQGWVLPPGTTDMLKLGALLSFAAGPTAWMLSKILKVRRMTGTDYSDAQDMEPAETATH